MGLAFTNKAIDAAIVIPPFVWQFEAQNLAVPFASVDDIVEPRPMTIAVIMINTDWAKKSPELVRNYVTAWLRGVRDYCRAYHGDTEPRGHHQGPDRERNRAQAGAAAQVSVAGAQPERPHQSGQHARHPGLVRDEQARQQGFPGRASGRYQLRRATPCRSLGRSRSRTRTASSPAAADARSGGEGT